MCACLCVCVFVCVCVRVCGEGEEGFGEKTKKESKGMKRDEIERKVEIERWQGEGKQTRKEGDESGYSEKDR